MTKGKKQDEKNLQMTMNVKLFSSRVSRVLTGDIQILTRLLA